MCSSSISITSLPLSPLTERAVVPLSPCPDGWARGTVTAQTLQECVSKGKVDLRARDWVSELELEQYQLRDTMSAIASVIWVGHVQTAAWVVEVTPVNKAKTSGTWVSSAGATTGCASACGESEVLMVTKESKYCSAAVEGLHRRLSHCWGNGLSSCHCHRQPQRQCSTRGFYEDGWWWGLLTGVWGTWPGFGLHRRLP